MGGMAIGYGPASSNPINHMFYFTLLQFVCLCVAGVPVHTVKQVILLTVKCAF